MIVQLYSNSPYISFILGRFPRSSQTVRGEQRCGRKHCGRRTCPRSVEMQQSCWREEDDDRIFWVIGGWSPLAGRVYASSLRRSHLPARGLCFALKYSYVGDPALTCSPIVPPPTLKDRAWPSLTSAGAKHLQHLPWPLE